MICLHDIKPCSDYQGKLQVEGTIDKESFSLERFEAFLQAMDFTVFSLGNPKVLICRRKDCMLFVRANGIFTISEVSSEKELLQIIDEIEVFL